MGSVNSEIIIFIFKNCLTAFNFECERNAIRDWNAIH